MASEMEGAALTPQPPTKSKIASTTLEEYFQSIQEPFRETRAGLARENKSPVGIFVVIFVFCLIPLIPYLLSKVASWAIGSMVVTVWALHFQLASFWFWWILSFAISLSMLAVVGKFSGPSTEEKKRWLSPAQMRFAYCFGVVYEIREYKKNHLSRHIETAADYLSKIAPFLIRISSSDTGEGFYSDLSPGMETPLPRRQPLVFGILGVLAGRPKWYRLQPETETILEACREFDAKLRDRLDDRKDLAAIEDALTDLAAYQYTEIPELSDSKTENRFEEGTESLLSFAQQVIALPPYRSEPLSRTPEEKLGRKILLALGKINVSFSHQNVLAAFFSWWIFLQLLFSGGFYIAGRSFGVKVDSTMLSAIIGGPILGAVTAVTSPRLAKTKKQQD